MLIVEDDEVLRAQLCYGFEKRGLRTLSAATHAEACQQSAHYSLTDALIDLRLPDQYGLSLVNTLCDAHANIRIVVLTGYGSIATAVAAVQAGARHYLTKPADIDAIEAALHTPLETPSDATDAQPAETTPATEVPSLATVEWEHIHRVLRDCNGNISQAAKLLGIHRRSLQRKLNRYP